MRLIETWLSSLPCSRSLGFSAGFGNATPETGPQEGVVTAACWQRMQDFSYPETQSLQGALRSVKARGKPSKLPGTLGLRSSLLTSGKELIYNIPGTEDNFKELLLHQLLSHPPPKGAQETLLEQKTKT